MQPGGHNNKPPQQQACHVMRNMKRAFLYLATISILTLLLALFIFKYYSVKEDRDDLKHLLQKAVYSIDRDNEHTFEDISDITINKTLSEHKYFDSVLNVVGINDSSQLQTNLSKSIINKLNLRDTMLRFSYRWCVLAVNWSKYYISDVLEHNSNYKYGDSIKLVFRITPTLGFQKNNYDIVNFSPNEYGSKEGTEIIFRIPTKKIIAIQDIPKEYDFKYWVILRNNYSSSLDTLYMSKSIFITH